MKTQLSKRVCLFVFVLSLCAAMFVSYRPKAAFGQVTTVSVTNNAARKLNYKARTIYVGHTLKLTLLNATTKVTWSTSSKAVATVSTKGLVTAKKAGSATITAKCGGKSFTCKITVKNPTLSKTSAVLKCDKSCLLSLKNAVQKNVTWKSSNERVATADGTRVYAHGPGTATITAKYCSMTLKCTVKVIDYEFNVYGIQLEPGEAYQLKATPRGPKVSYTWSSTNKDIATVDKNGLVHATPGKGGSCKIRINFTATTGKSYCETTVRVKPFSTLYEAQINSGNSYTIATDTSGSSPVDGMDCDLTLLSSGIGTCYADHYEHPADMDTVNLNGYNYYFLSDTWENRVIIFRVPENKAFNGADVSSYIYCVLGQTSTTTSVPGCGLGNLNWPVGVATAKQVDGTVKIFVADAKNNRILVWNDLPSEGAHGTAADYSIMQMVDPKEYPYGVDTLFPNEQESRLAWPWDLYIDGDRLIATATSNGYVLIWENGLPTETDKYPDKIIKTGGTPRTITANGNMLLIGDHNIDQTDGPQLAALRVFNDISSISYASVSSKTDAGKTLFQYTVYPGDFIHWDGNSGQPSGYVLTRDLITKGKKTLPAGTLILHEAGALTVWRDGRIDSVDDAPDYYVGGSQIDCDDYYYFTGGDICTLVQDDAGNLYSLGINAGKVVGFTNGTFPDEPKTIDINKVKRDGDAFLYDGAYYWNRPDGVVEKHCIESPSICIGASDPRESIPDTLNKYQNCNMTSNGKYLVSADGYNSVLCLWKHIPGENDAAPDAKFRFASALEDTCFIENADGTTGLLICERARLYYWKNIENAIAGKLPDSFLNGTIGTVKADGANGIHAIEYCDGYFYMAQNNKIYMYKGIPKQDTKPAGVLTLEFTGSTGGRIAYDNDVNMHVTKCNDGHTYVAVANTTSTASIIDTADILSGTAASTARHIEGAYTPMIDGYKNGTRIRRDVYRNFNGAADCLVTEAGKVVLCDGGFTRVLIWNSIDDAVTEYTSGVKKQAASLGHGSNDYDVYDVMLADPTTEIFPAAYDPISIQSVNTFYGAHFLCYDGTYLWVGDYKFSGGIKRFTIDLN